MKARTFDYLANTLIAIAVIVSSIYIWKFVRSFQAPDYEIVDLNLKYNYSYTTKDGEKISSFYVPAWHNGIPVAYDPKYGNAVSFNDNYINEITEMMPPSKYGFLSRYTKLEALIAVVLCGIIVILLGIYIKELILGIYPRFTYRFSDCAYFFKCNRWAGNNFAKETLAETIDWYVDTEKQSIIKRYGKERADFIINMLNYIKLTRSVIIPYKLSIVNYTTPDPKDAITKMISFLENENPIDENEMKYYISCREKNWETNIITHFTTENLKDEVNNQLNEIFEKLLGERIFTFQAAYSGILSVNLAFFYNFNFTMTVREYCSGDLPSLYMLVKINSNNKLLLDTKLSVSKDFEYVFKEGMFSKTDIYIAEAKSCIKQLSKVFHI